MVILGYNNPPGFSSSGVVNSKRWRQTVIPSTNGHGSAEGIACIYNHLLQGALLDRKLLREAVRPQASGFCPVLQRQVSFGLGFQPSHPKRPLGKSSKSFGHFGTGGSLGFADPEYDIAFGFVLNRIIPRWQSPTNRALVEAVYASL